MLPRKHKILHRQTVDRLKGIRRLQQQIVELRAEHYGRELVLQHLPNGPKGDDGNGAVG